jgi:hypothetical protein
MLTAIPLFPSMRFLSMSGPHPYGVDFVESNRSWEFSAAKNRNLNDLEPKISDLKDLKPTIDNKDTSGHPDVRAASE